MTDVAEIARIKARLAEIAAHIATNSRMQPMREYLALCDERDALRAHLTQEKPR